VVFSGSEPATVAELDARFAANEPILMYWWTPTAAVSKYDLVNVLLPAYNDECGASAAAGDGGVDCDYPEDVLFKAASANSRRRHPTCSPSSKAFTLTTDDQLSMLPPVEIDGLDPPRSPATGWRPTRASGGPGCPDPDCPGRHPVWSTPGFATPVRGGPTPLGSFGWRYQSTCSGGSGVLPRIRSAAFSASIITGA
jgi:hypothetical protein